MQITITELNGYKTLCQREYPSDFISENGLEEMDGSFDWGLGEAGFLECWFDGMHMLTTDLPAEMSFKVNIRSEASVYMMIFCLEGGVKLAIEDDLKSDIALNTQQAAFLSSTLYDLELLQDSKIVFIHLTEKYLCRLNLKDRCASLIERPTVFGITPAMKMVLSAALECSYPTTMKRIFLESKILELLFLQLASQSPLIPASLNIPFRSQDIARIQYAKELIEQNIRTPYSLMDLSRKVGLNDFKLKKGFKAMLGFTVFGYLHELRMEQAKQMLLEKRAINQVAYEVGYKNSHHFSTAFKKKYGIVPSRLNKQDNNVTE